MKARGISGIDVRGAFFEAVGELGSHLFRCNECAKTYKSPHGNSNLIAHASTHPGWLDKICAGKTANGALNKFVVKTVSPKAKNVFGWIEQCVMLDRPFSFVEDPMVRRYTKLESISEKTLIKYMELIQPMIEEKLTAKIAAIQGRKNLGVIFDCKY